MFRQNFNPFVYFVADPFCCAGRSVVDVVLAAAEGGVTMVQYGNKGDDMALIADEAAMLAELLKPFGIPFLVNDHVEIARSVGADGVHIGQDDMDPAAARRLMGADAIVGLTAFTEAHIAAVDPETVDYIGTGPVYSTQTDKGKPVLGVERFAELVTLSPVPVVGIGGITPSSAGVVREAGAVGVAMMRSVGAAEDVKLAASLFQF